MCKSHVSSALAAFAIILSNLICFQVTQAQPKTPENAEKLLDKLVSDRPDTTGACKLVQEKLTSERIYLIEYAIPAKGAQVTIVFNDEKAEPNLLPWMFSLPMEPASKIKSLELSLPGQTQPYIYSFQDVSERPGLRHVIIPQPPHASVSVQLINCPELSYIGLDAPGILMPLTKRRISFLTASFGAITAGTSIWFLIEKGNADNQYQRYQEATNWQRAIEMRIAVEKSRTRRNIAGAVAIASSATFALLLARDLILRKERGREKYTHVAPSANSEKRFSLDLKPPVSARGVTLSVNMKF